MMGPPTGTSSLQGSSAARPRCPTTCSGGAAPSPSSAGSRSAAARTRRTRRPSSTSATTAPSTGRAPWRARGRRRRSVWISGAASTASARTTAGRSNRAWNRAAPRVSSSSASPSAQGEPTYVPTTPRASPKPSTPPSSKRSKSPLRRATRTPRPSCLRCPSALPCGARTRTWSPRAVRRRSPRWSWRWSCLVDYWKTKSLRKRTAAPAARRRGASSRNSRCWMRSSRRSRATRGPWAGLF
mmetsp:Transcript_18783/g.63446  ORF Transcript_18783/g.63446 Transcript_18783/m.63446 type:complete len:241 (-) Transcript_18783:770-1492(-)